MPPKQLLRWHGSRHAVLLTLLSFLPLYPNVVQALDLALEDTLYALDKALNAGLVQPDAYIKQVHCPAPLL
jgi:hypothetical protein